MTTAKKIVRRKKIRNRSFFMGISLSEAAGLTGRTRKELWVLAKRRGLFTLIGEANVDKSKRRKIYLLPGEVSALRDGGIEGLERYKAENNGTNKYSEGR